MIAWAALNLNSDMTQARNPDKPRLVTGGRFRLVRNQRDDGGAMAGADAPNVEVGYAIIALRFEAMRDLADDPIPGPHVEQHGSRSADQVPRPVRYNQHTGDTHHRVQPDPTEQAPDRQADQHEHGNRCVGDHMDVGRAEIMVGMVMMVMLVVAVVLMHRMVITVAVV